MPMWMSRNMLRFNARLLISQESLFLRAPVRLTPTRQCHHARLWRPELYVLDKYGSLVNIHSAWTPWVLKMGQRLETSTGLSLEEKILSSLDICTFTKRVRSGAVGDGTTWQIKRELQNVLHREGLDRSQAQHLVDQSWELCTLCDPSVVEQLKELETVFIKIKRNGAKIAICTSDLHSLAAELLERSGLIGLVDHVTSIADSTNQTGEANHVTRICNEVSVAPDRAVLIGDTATDMQMGRSAGVAVNVGVLTGAGTRLDLHGLADFITHDFTGAIDRIQELTADEVNDLVKTKKPHAKPRTANRKVDLVIFDKDGTLLCFNALWTPWAEGLVAKLEAATGLENLSDKVMDGLGYCSKEQKWRPSVFTEGTTKQSIDKISEILVNEGVDKGEVGDHISSSWTPGDHSSENKHLRTFDNPAGLFKSLKESGIKVAVCTSDERVGTERFLADLGAESYVDMVVCGDDPDSIPKPDAHNALMICEKLGVDPGRTVVVGDTDTDMKMGRAAKLGATVAVLSGVGDVGHLAANADHLVPSVGHVLNIVNRKSMTAS